MVEVNKHTIIFKESRDPLLCPKDLHGCPIPSMIKIGEADGDFQPLSQNEQLKEFGEYIQDTYRIYLDIDAVTEQIDSGCEFKVDGFKTRMEVYGNPDVRLECPEPFMKIILHQKGVDDKPIIEAD